MVDFINIDQHRFYLGNKDHPDNQRFVRFRRALEDGVTVAINSGKVIGSGWDTYCPLGCLPTAVFRRPGGLASAGSFDITEAELSCFLAGFDLPDPPRWFERHESLKFSPHYTLARAYRARFIRP